MASTAAIHLRMTLLHDYAVATKHHAWAVSELERQRPRLLRDRYDLVYRMVEDAREDCECLRRALSEFRD